MLPYRATLHGKILLSRPRIWRSLSFGLSQYFAISAREGCTVPNSSVQRDMITHSLPSHVQWKPNRVCAMGYAGDRSSAGVQVCPPSSEMSTLRPNRSALRAPQGYAPGQADDKEKKQNEKQKGDTSNEVRKGTFLKRFDTRRRRT